MSTGKNLGVLLVAEMSNAGNLFTNEYTKAVVNMGEKEEWANVVSGFIAQSRVSQVRCKKVPVHYYGTLKWSFTYKQHA